MAIARRRATRGEPRAASASTPAPVNDDASDDASDATAARPNKPVLARVLAFAADNYFVFGLLTSLALASVAPHIGCTGGPLRPELTVNAIGVRAMFLIAGMNLPTSELARAATNVRANLFVQFFIFGFAGVVVARVLAPALLALDLLTPALVDGLIVLACLPTTIGSGVALTSAAEGSVSLAVFHAVFGNLAGIVATPALLFLYLGGGGGGGGAGVNLADAVAKLCSVVLAPVVAGACVRAVPRAAAALTGAGVKRALRRVSDGVILAIVYNTFCNTFRDGFGVPPSQFASLTVVLFALLALYKTTVFVAGNAAGLSRKDVVAATFMASQKTLAFGLPLIKTMFGTSPNLAWLCLPTLVYHPMQLMVGSALVPVLRRWGNEETEAAAAAETTTETTTKSAETAAEDARKEAEMYRLCDAFEGKFDAPDISAAQLKSEIPFMRRGGKGNKPFVIVDVRTEQERAVSMIAGAVTKSEFEANQRALDSREDVKVIAYCTIGYRSVQYVEKLRKDGYDAYNLRGSILAWTHAGGALETRGEETRRVHTFGKTWDLASSAYDTTYFKKPMLSFVTSYISEKFKKRK